MLFEMLFWNFRDKFENKIERVLVHYLKRFRTSENILKSKVSKACIITIFFNCIEKIENKVSKACNSGTIWNDLEMK